MGKQWDPLTDMPSLKGKKVVITGGNTGIGLSTVKFLALQGATVYLAARSEARAKAAAEGILKSHPSIHETQIIWLPLDLSDLKSIHLAIEELKSKETKIDILINNAAVVTASVETFGDDWEPHMAVCHIGHFVFTNGVLPLLKNAAKDKDSDVRIVTLCSNASVSFLSPSYPFDFKSMSFLTKPAPYYSLMWRLVFSRLLFTTDMIRYSVAKTANMMFAQKLQQMMDSQGIPILSIGVHPGAVASDGVKTIGTGLFNRVINMSFVTTDQGALNSLFAATAKEVRATPEKYKGRYLEPVGQVVEPHVVTKDHEQVEGLWENTTIAVNKYLAKIHLPVLQNW